MGIEYHINERDELITITATGAVTRAEACSCIDKLLQDEAFDASLPQLIDLRTAEPEGEPDDMASFEHFLFGDYRPKLSALVAIVVNPDWNETQCAKAFWISCMLDGAELFDGWNQACKWLIQRDFTVSDMETHEIETHKKEAPDEDMGAIPSVSALSNLADLDAIDATDDPEGPQDSKPPRDKAARPSDAGLTSGSATPQD